MKNISNLEHPTKLCQYKDYGGGKTNYVRIVTMPFCALSGQKVYRK